MKTTKPNHRRNFLVAATLGGAGAAVAAAKAVTPGEAEAAPEAAGPSGYHVSEHILKYYKTTEV